MELDDAKLQEKIGWSPFEEQGEIIEKYDEVRDIRLAAGRRWGKSALCAYIALREFLKEGAHIWIAAPSYDLSEKVFNYLIRWLGIAFPTAVGKGTIKISNRVPQSIGLPAIGAWIKCKSAESPESMLGEELDLVVGDEAARIKEIVWNQYVRPCLTSRSGKSVMISTPLGKNWFFKECQRAKRSEDAIFRRFRSIDSPYFSREEWEREKETNHEQIFKQEYEASFLDAAASWFPNADIEACIGGRLEKPKKGHYYTMGIDWAKHKDYTVITIIDRSTHGLVFFKRFQGIDYATQMDHVVEISKDYNRPETWMDTTGCGEPLSDVLKRYGNAVNIRDYRSYTNKTKEALLSKLRIWIERRRIKFPRVDILIDELGAFGVDKTPAGRLKLEAPSGLHDDAVYSLALAVWPLGEEPVTAGIAEPIVTRSPKYGVR
jgi:hypothetical protein